MDYAEYNSLLKKAIWTCSLEEGNQMHVTYKVVGNPEAASYLKRVSFVYGFSGLKLLSAILFKEKEVTISKTSYRIISVSRNSAATQIEEVIRATITGKEGRLNMFISEYVPSECKQTQFAIPGESKAMLPVSIYWWGKRSCYLLPAKEFRKVRDHYGFPLIRNLPRLRWYYETRPDFEDLSEESFLKQIGYSVSKADGLSEEERQDILYDVFKRGFMTKEEITSHLNWLIETFAERNNMGEAVLK